MIKFDLVNINTVQVTFVWLTDQSSFCCSCCSTLNCWVPDIFEAALWKLSATVCVLEVSSVYNLDWYMPCLQFELQANVSCGLCNNARYQCSVIYIMIWCKCDSVHCKHVSLYTVNVNDRKLDRSHSWSLILLLFQTVNPCSCCSLLSLSRSFRSSTCVKECGQLHDHGQDVNTFLYFWPIAEYMKVFTLWTKSPSCLNFLFSLGSVCGCMRAWRQRGCWRLKILLEIVFLGRWGNREHILLGRIVTTGCGEVFSVCEHDWFIHEPGDVKKYWNKAIEIHMPVSVFM